MLHTLFMQDFVQLPFNKTRKIYEKLKRPKRSGQNTTHQYKVDYSVRLKFTNGNIYPPKISTCVSKLIHTLTNISWAPALAISLYIYIYKDHFNKSLSAKIQVHSEQRRGCFLKIRFLRLSRSLMRKKGKRISGKRAVYTEPSYSEMIFCVWEKQWFRNTES